MRRLNVNYSRGQMKIQQMAFVLVITMIFFAMVGVFYASIRVGSLKGNAEQIREDEAREIARKISGSPELSWSAEDCSSCIDMDKALALKSNQEYEEFWDLAFVQIERVYPSGEGECTSQNYPECGTITLLNEGNYIAHEAFVALCRYDEKEEFSRCELGRVSVGFKPVE